jgi:hypothetical protein
LDGDLERDLAAAERLGARRPPTRQAARPLLLGIGRLLLDGQAAQAAPALERLAACIARDPGRWGEALQSEISMAVTEVVRSADPRWLDHPRYDWGYVLEARQLVEARLAALDALGWEVEDALLEALARADELLAARGADGPPAGSA